jgi:hypothetical protein
MPNFVLFETTESVIEVLWDIALAFFLVRLGFIYFLMNFVSGIFISWLVSTQITPRTNLTTTQAELLLVPCMLWNMGISARHLIRNNEIPRVRGFRLAIGVVGLACMVLADSLLALVLYEGGRGDWIMNTDFKAGSTFAGLLALYTFMPWVQMILCERDENRETQHGHENKTLVHAV